MDHHRTPSIQKKLDQPAFDAHLVRCGPQLVAPAADFAGWHARKFMFNVLGECGTNVALRVDEPNQERAATRVHLMSSVGPHPDRATFPSRMTHVTPSGIGHRVGGAPGF
jgi:hypothetical protein